MKKRQLLGFLQPLLVFPLQRDKRGMGTPHLTVTGTAGDGSEMPPCCRPRRLQKNSMKWKYQHTSKAELLPLSTQGWLARSHPWTLFWCCYCNTQEPQCLWCQYFTYLFSAREEYSGNQIFNVKGKHGYGRGCDILKITSQASDRVGQLSHILWGQTTVMDSQHTFATAPAFLRMGCLCLTGTRHLWNSLQLYLNITPEASWARNIKNSGRKRKKLHRNGAFMSTTHFLPLLLTVSKSSREY